MIKLRKIYYFMIKIFIKFFIKSKIIPNTIFSKINIKDPVFYILYNHSIINLLILQKQCKKNNLPNPYHKIKIKYHIFDRYLFIYKKYFNKSSDNLIIKKIQDYIDNFYKYRVFNIKIIFVYMIFNRYPKKIYKINKKIFLIINIIKKFFSFFLIRKRNFIFFSTTSLDLSIIKKYQQDKDIAKKLLRLIRIYFLRKKNFFIGHDILSKKYLLNQLLKSQFVKKIIQHEKKIKKINHKYGIKDTKYIIKEMYADFSYFMIYITDLIMKLVIKRMYNKIHIFGKNYLYQLLKKKCEIIYLPCHRSHMDYLLLSYILYHQGFFLPYIAAGINLNFWPIGFIFRNLGAFFIRRTFTKNKLYSVIFREYLITLFKNNNSIEYFIEGGRSRTGKLLPPKKGILSIIIQAILQKRITSSVILVPIYISYDQVIEISSYVKELNGYIKKKEGFFQILKVLKKLKNFGDSYISFGKPLSLIKYLNSKVPNWRNINSFENTRINKSSKIINLVAKKVMISINEACVINAVNICVTILLSSKNNQLHRKKMIEHIKFYLQLFNKVLYLSSVISIIKNINANTLLNNVLKMKTHIYEKIFSKNNKIIFLKKAIFNNYYKNNIFHTLILPSLIISIIDKNKILSKEKLYFQIKLIYPILQNELFLCWNEKNLSFIIDAIINEFIKQKLLIFINHNIYPNKSKNLMIKSLSSIIEIILQRYMITLLLISLYPNIKKINLKIKSLYVAKNLAKFNNKYASELFDKEAIYSLIIMLYKKKYTDEKGNIKIKIIKKMYNIIIKLIKISEFIKIKKIISSI